MGWLEEDFHIRIILYYVIKEVQDVRHLLTSCVFAHKFWFEVLQAVDLQNLVPWASERSFANDGARLLVELGRAKEKE